MFSIGAARYYLYRLQTVISPDNTTSTTTYCANQISVTTTNSGLSRTTTKKYNAAGWLIESTDNFGSVVKNEYYCNGNLSKTYIVGQTAATVSLEYDHRGNRTLLIDPNYGSMATIYNAYGELVQQTNPRNETTMFTYDKLGRETKETGGPEGEINWIYSTSIGRIGTLETILKNDHRTNYLYDNYLRLTSEIEIIDGASYTTQYTYDELGRPFTTTHPTGIKLRNGYSDHGDLTTVTLEKDNKQLWQTEDMNPMGQVTKFKTGNELVTDQSYYPLSMRSYTVKTAKSGSDPIQDLEYGWYGLGNLEYRKKWLNRTNNTSLTESFTYDGLDRLEYIKLNGIETGYHEYDTYNGIQSIALGNITLKRNDNQAIYNNAIYGTNGYGPNAITEVTTANPILTGPRQDISYNGYDKIDSITEGVHNLQIQYGHNRQRISQQYTDGDHTVDKVWAGACEYITKNGQQYKYTYLSGPMGVFAINIINPDGTENLRYIHKDHLGSWNTITDEQGNLLQELSFDAWGNRRDPATWSAYTGTLPEPLFDRGFTGHEHLYAINLINMNGRMYDPVLGRMLSPDNYMQAPDFSQNFNRYSYCLNNPLKYDDPDGEWVHLVVGAVAGGMFNWMLHGSEFTLEGLGYFGIGAAAGALGAGVGAGISSAMATGSAAGGASTFAAGFWGTSAALPAASSFATGAAIGAGAGFTSGFITETGNSLIQGKNLGEALRSGAQTGLIAGASGALLGGIGGGIDANMDNRDFWDGTTDDEIVNGWRHFSCGGWKAMPGERQGYYLIEDHKIIKSWRADQLTNGQTNFSTPAGQGMTIDFTAGTNKTFQFGNTSANGLRNKVAFGLQLRITGLEQHASFQAFANNDMFMSTPSIRAVFDSFASSFSWMSSGDGSFTLLFFQ